MHFVAKPPKLPDDHIRVAVLTQFDSFAFSCDGRYKIVVGGRSFKGRPRDAVMISVDGTDIRLRLGRGTARIEDSIVYFLPQSKSFKIDTKLYRGILILRSVGAQNYLINVLSLEDYLKGVVPAELGSTRPEVFEAMKAQAVAARTYAHAHKGKNSRLGFDLFATVQDQVYGGINVENDLVNRAIRETKNEILTYQGRPIEAKYHSTCGGRTANSYDIWADTAIPYLKSVDDPYCSKSPHTSWQEDISFSKLMKNLGYDSLSNERITKILLRRNTQSGRVIEMTIVTNLREEKIPKWKIRKALVGELASTGMLRSTYLDMATIRGQIRISGRGYGHGVGLCQYGSMEMARQGKDYAKILEFYYPGSRLRKKRL